MKRMIEAKLAKVEVFNDGNNWSMQWNGHTYTFQGTIEQFSKVLMKIKAADNYEEPRSYRSMKYVDIANEIANGQDRIIWAWEHTLRKLYDE